MKNLFASNLSFARQTKGYTMEELASKINCSKQAISHYENGLRNPDSKTLISLSEVLGTDQEYFYNENNSVKFNLLNVNYRDGEFLTQKQREHVENKAGDILKNYLELEIISNDFHEFINPLEDIFINNVIDAEKAAKSLRKKWKLGDGPLHNISNFLEKKGVRVIKIDFGFNYFHEGLSGWVEENIPVIVINSKPQDISRVRFTVLHELGHLLLNVCNSLSFEEIERICDTFAGAVLLPSDVLIEEFGKNRTAITMPELKRIKELYGISISAIMVRAKMINLISWESYNKWKQSDLSNQDFGQFGGVEEPQKFMQMLYRCLSERKIGFDKAAKLSHIDEMELKLIYKQEISF